jgi:MFS family permease
MRTPTFRRRGVEEAARETALARGEGMAGVLKQRNFVLYFFFETITIFGSGMLFIGVNWYVRQASGTNAAVGIVMSLSILSGFLVFPLAGTVADRFARRSTLFALGLARAALFALFLVVSLLGLLDFRLTYLLVVANGIGFAFHMPVSRGFLQEILDRDNLVGGNALIEMSLQAGLFVSAGLTGIVLEAAGIQAVLAIAAGTYLIGSLLLRGIRYTPVEIRDARQRFYTQFVRGLSFLTQRRRLLFLGIVMQIPFIVVITSNVILPGYVENRLQGSAVVFGFADMSYGLAAFCSSLLLSLFGKKAPRYPLIIALFSTVIASLSGLYFNRLLPGLYLGLFVFGLANTPLKILVTAILMEIVDKEQFGRAMAFWTGVSSLLQVGLTFALGYLIDRVPENNGYIILAAVTALGLAGLIGVLPRLRQRTEYSVHHSGDQ